MGKKENRERRERNDRGNIIEIAKSRTRLERVAELGTCGYFQFFKTNEKGFFKMFN